MQGWRYQLSVFGNVAANLANASAAATVDAWFGAWAERDAAARERTLQKIASIDVRFRDRVSLLEGIADLVPHIGAAQRFMPDMRLTRDGEVRHCQGTVLADWIAAGPDGTARGRGTNVFTLRPDGVIGRRRGLLGGNGARTGDAEEAKGTEGTGGSTEDRRNGANGNNDWELIPDASPVLTSSVPSCPPSPPPSVSGSARQLGDRRTEERAQLARPIENHGRLRRAIRVGRRALTT